MFDPTKATKYDRTVSELEEMILFCICVAGKPALRTARILDQLLPRLRDGHRQLSPFEAIATCTQSDLLRLMKKLGFGCYTLKSRGLYYMARSGLDLKKCTAEELAA